METYSHVSLLIRVRNFADKLFCIKEENGHSRFKFTIKTDPSTDIS